MPKLTVRATKTHVQKLAVHIWKNGTKEVREIKSLGVVALVQNGHVESSLKTRISARLVKSWLGCIPTPRIESFQV